jgi:probable rRNA maturation factor
MTAPASRRQKRDQAPSHDVGRSPLPIIDLTVESPLWTHAPGAAATVRRAIGEAAREIAKAQPAAGEVAVVLTDDAAIRALNHRWRNLDAATNVLSFPASGTFRRPGAPLGDIVIAYETAAREAAAECRPLGDHLAHLAVHGFLHLLGYDHESDEAADAMEGLERTILARLGVSDPYATHDAG